MQVESMNLFQKVKKTSIEIMAIIATKDSATVYVMDGFRTNLLVNRVCLGVQIVEPGAKVVRIVPHLGDLEWAEGTFPTPNGIIKIHHKKQKDGTIYSHIEAPAGTTVLRQ